VVLPYIFSRYLLTSGWFNSKHLLDGDYQISHSGIVGGAYRLRLCAWFVCQFYLLLSLANMSPRRLSPLSRLFSIWWVGPFHPGTSGKGQSPRGWSALWHIPQLLGAMTVLPYPILVLL
jgi:hypothetical protein